MSFRLQITLFCLFIFFQIGWAAQGAKIDTPVGSNPAINSGPKEPHVSEPPASIENSIPEKSPEKVGKSNDNNLKPEQIAPVIEPVTKNKIKKVPTPSDKSTTAGVPIKSNDENAVAQPEILVNVPKEKSVPTNTEINIEKVTDPNIKKEDLPARNLLDEVVNTNSIPETKSARDIIVSGNKIEKDKKQQNDKKTEIQSVNKKEVEPNKLKEPKAVSEPKAKGSEIKEPKVKEPKVKEPKVKEPKAKEPKVKEPKVKEPKVKEPKVKEPKEVKEDKNPKEPDELPITTPPVEPPNVTPPVEPPDITPTVAPPDITPTVAPPDITPTVAPPDVTPSTEPSEIISPASPSETNGVIIPPTSDQINVDNRSSNPMDEVVPNLGQHIEATFSNADNFFNLSKTSLLKLIPKTNCNNWNDEIKAYATIIWRYKQVCNASSNVFVSFPQCECNINNFKNDIFKKH